MGGPAIRSSGTVRQQDVVMTQTVERIRNRRVREVVQSHKSYAVQPKQNQLVTVFMKSMGVDWMTPAVGGWNRLTERRQ